MIGSRCRRRRGCPAETDASVTLSEADGQGTAGAPEGGGAGAGEKGVQSFAWAQPPELTE